MILLLIMFEAVKVVFCKVISEILFAIVSAHIDKIDDLDTPAGSYFFRVHNINTKKMCEIFLKLTAKSPEWRHWRRSNIFVVNF